MTDEERRQMNLEVAIICFTVVVIYGCVISCV